MRLLVLSDVHGNMDALEAIEEDHDTLFFLGDLVDYGPSPRECIDYVKRKATRVVRGNHDNAVATGADCRCGQRYRHLSLATRQYMHRLLRREDVGYLGAMPLTLNFELDGIKICMAHASPRDPLYRYITPEITDRELEMELEGVETDLVLLGHSHLPMCRKIGGKTVVNPGSVGQPRDGIPMASYAVVEDGGVELKRAEYDVGAAIERLFETYESSLAQELADILKRGR